MFLKNLLKRTTTRNQYISAFLVNLIALSHGCAVGWLSPFLPYLKSSDSHLPPITSEDASWIGSLLALGGFVGAIVFGQITEKFGKKTALFLLVFPHLGFWCLVYMSTHVYHLYLARFIAGITGGGIIRTVSLFIAEISENRIRGMLGSFMVFALSSGALLIFSLGTYVNFFTVPLLILVLPSIFMTSLFFLHDTPTSLIARGKNDEALESLKFYRTSSGEKTETECLLQELKQLKESSEVKNEEKLSLKDFLTKPALKGLSIGIFLMFLNQFSGSFCIMTYTADIFKSSGSNFTPNESSIFVAFIQLLGVYFSSICVDRFGRKILMAISSAGTSIFLFTLATYSYLNESGYEMTQLSWVPVASLSLAVFLASLGIIPLPYVIVTELMPNKVRNASCTICMCSVTFFCFIVLKIFPPLVLLINLYGCMWFFSAVCLVGTIITILFIPETKGKSLIEC